MSLEITSRVNRNLKGYLLLEVHLRALIVAGLGALLPLHHLAHLLESLRALGHNLHNRVK